MQEEQRLQQQYLDKGGEPPEKPVHVKVFAKKGADGKIDWEIDWKLDNGPDQGNTDIKVPVRKHNDPRTPIRFRLDDSSGHGLTFDKADPIWVKESECPTESCSHAEIPRDQMTVEETRLTVVDLNTVECVLCYNLRFRDRAKNPVGHDPRIINGGTSD